MKLVLNETGEIRKETFKGREYIVAPTTLMRAMNLDGGYVPKNHVRKSAPAWNGTPVTLNHPRNDAGQLVSANSPEVAENTWLGYVFNAKAEDDKVVGETWIDIENAREIGGEAEKILNRLENNESLEVSTSYFGDKLQPGTYDGGEWSEVMGNIRPDHLAMLPNKAGKCSIEDGCGAAVANADDPLRVAVNADDPDEGEDQTANKSVAGVVFTGTANGTLDESDISSDDFEGHYLFPGDNKSSSSFPVVDADGNLRRGNVESAWNLRGHAPDKSEAESKLMTLNDEFDDPPIDAENETSGNWAMNQIRRMLGISDDEGPVDETEEGPTENDETNETMERDEHIDYLVENHEFKRESLEGMGDTCLERTYNSFVDEEEAEENETEERETEPPAQNDADVMTKSELESLIDQRVEERVAANRESEERQDLVNEITSNSDDWSEDDLLETPVDVLTNIRDEVVEETEGAANYAAQPGANAGSGGEDAGENFPALTASERISESDD